MPPVISQSTNKDQVRMRPTILALVAATAWCAALSGANAKNSATSPLSEAEKSVIAEAVGDRLKDPDSAKFKWLDWVTPSIHAGEATYCARVNAKNSFGGYGGYVVFQATVSTKDGRPVEVSNVALADDAGGVVSMVVKDRCRSAGYGDLLPGQPTLSDLTKQMQDETDRLNRQIDDAERRLQQPVE